MQTRPLGRTGLKLPILSFGASSLGQEFRQVDINEALASVPAALDCGMNYIDTSPFYGRGMSEVLLGVALRDVPRDSYVLSTKLGRKAVKKVVKGSALAGPRTVKRTVSVPRAWVGKKVTVRVVLKNGATTITRSKILPKF